MKTKKQTNKHICIWKKNYMILLYYMICMIHVNSDQNYREKTIIIVLNWQRTYITPNKIHLFFLILYYYTSLSCNNKWFNYLINVTTLLQHFLCQPTVLLNRVSTTAPRPWSRLPRPLSGGIPSLLTFPTVRNQYQPRIAKF